MSHKKSRIVFLTTSLLLCLLTAFVLSTAASGNGQPIDTVRENISAVDLEQTSPVKLTSFDLLGVVEPTEKMLVQYGTAPDSFGHFGNVFTVSPEGSLIAAQFSTRDADTNQYLRYVAVYNWQEQDGAYVFASILGEPAAPHCSNYNAFGRALVFIDESTLLVSDPDNRRDAPTCNTEDVSGVIYEFDLSVPTGPTLVQEIWAEDIFPMRRFGSTLAVLFNGDLFVGVTSYSDVAPNAVALYLKRLDPTQYVLEQVLISDTPYLLSDNGIVLSTCSRDNGTNAVAIGTPDVFPAGAVRIFEQESPNSVFELTKQLFSKDAVGGYLYYGSTKHGFGEAVSFTDPGICNQLVIGWPTYSSAEQGQYSGSVHVFNKESYGWFAGPGSMLTPTDCWSTCGFGTSIARLDGLMVVGENDGYVGAASWRSRTGAVAFQCVSGDSACHTRFVPNPDNEAGASFGENVFSDSTGRIFVTAPTARIGAHPAAGKVYVFGNDN